MVCYLIDNQKINRYEKIGVKTFANYILVIRM